MKVSKGAEVRKNIGSEQESKILFVSLVMMIENLLKILCLEKFLANLLN